MAITLNCIGQNIFEIGAFDAKTYFSELLRRVQSGAVINISKNGKPVAVLQSKQNSQNQTALNAHQRILERGKKFRSMMESSDAAPITAEEIRELKNDGRKY
ncbi:MAG: type II toxin-antitoxin system prevent-host-death family antitoxin [Treponema sp.]|nr:type II toxin-antitoxin system prevent-host-death family antitoxin [Treponema sp.]